MAQEEGGRRSLKRGFSLQKPEPSKCPKYIYLNKMENGLKMRSLMFQPDVLRLGEGHVSSSGLLVLRLGVGKLRLGEPESGLYYVLSSFLRLGNGCLRLGEPPRLDEVVPLSTTSAFSYFNPFFACFYFLFLHNIRKWGISGIFRNLV